MEVNAKDVAFDVLLKVFTGSKKLAADVVGLDSRRHILRLLVFRLSHRRDVIVGAEELEVVPEFLSDLRASVASGCNGELLGEVLRLKHKLVNQSTATHRGAVCGLLLLICDEVAGALGELLESGETKSSHENELSA